MNSSNERIRSTDLLVFEALVAVDGMDPFNCLPKAEQERLLDWVARSSDESARERRTEALVWG